MIGSLVTINSYITTLKGFAFKSVWYTENGVPIVKVSDFTQDSVSPDKVAFIPIENSSDFEKYQLQKGDVLIQTVGSWEHNPNSVVGKVVRVPEILSDSLLNQNIVKIIPKETIDRSFLYYLLKNDVFKGYILNTAQGAATQASITLESIKAFKFIYKDKATQRKIASILSAYDDLIENNLKRIKLLEEKAFVTYKGIVSSEKMEEFTIDELANVVMGQSPTSDTYTDEKDNLPFHQGVTNYSNYFVVHKIYCKAPIKIAEEGDILFSVRAPVGRINFTTERICIGRGLCAFRSKKGFQNYFYHQLKDFFFEEDVIGNGAIFNAVTKVELMKVKLKTPSEKIQKEFEIESKHIYDLILNLTKQNTRLREARDILLPRLMNGQIEV